MISFEYRRAAAVAGVCTVVLAGCAHRPKLTADGAPSAATAGPATPYVATPYILPEERQHKIIELLNAGQPDQARIEAKALLQEHPDSAEATTLLNEIDADPKVLLGGQNFAYKVKPGDTFLTLADRFLGDSNLFYALARYNNIDVPNQITVGQAILIPGTGREHEHDHDHEHRDEAPPALRRRIEPSTGAAHAPPAVAPPSPAAAPAAAPDHPATDPARARTLRSEALVEMDKGSIDKAVGLLREAARLDPANTAIAGDLARAVRIQAATHH